MAHFAQLCGNQRHGFELFQRDQTGTQAVIHIVIVVGDLVGQIGDLRFQRGAAIVQEALAQLAQLGGVLRRAMLEDAFARFEAQVQSVECGIALFQLVHDAQRLQVVLESAIRFHAGVQRILPGMAERGVAEIVRQRDRFGQIFVQAQAPRDGARDLRHFDAVGQAGAKQVAFVIDEYLGLVFEAAKRAGMDDAIAVALEFAAPLRRILGYLPAARVAAR